MPNSSLTAPGSEPSQTLAAGLEQKEEPGFAPLLLQYWGMLLRRWWLVAGIIAACVIGALILTLLTQPKYTATARLEISRQQASVTKVEGLEADEVDRSNEFYSTQYSLLRSRSLAERVMRRMRLERNARFLEAYKLAPANSETGAAGGVASLRQQQERITNILLGSVAVLPIRNSSLVDVQIVGPEPEIAAELANVWAEEFIRQGIDRRFGATADARQFLETRLEELRTKLDDSEREMVSYAEQNGIVRLSETVSADGQTRTASTVSSMNVEALNNALNVATAERFAAEARSRSVGTSGANSESLVNPTINTLRQRRAELAAQQAQLLVRFDPEYPEVQAIQRQVAALDAGIQREEGRVRASLSGEYRAALDRENSLRARVADVSSRLSQENRALIRYNVLQREVDTNRQLYDALLQRYKEIGVSGVSANNVSLVDQAEVPKTPSSPRLRLNLLIAFVLGLCLAGAVVFILENIDEGVRDLHRAATQLNLPLLGATPEVSETSDIMTDLADPKSALAEAYMSVSTNLALSTTNGVPKSLSFTSVGPGEAKTTTAMALATLLGRIGKSVLIIDADMRRPRLHDLAQLPRTTGLSNYLAGGHDWSALVQPTKYPNLSFMSAGPIPPSAAELLSGDRMATLVREAGMKYDHVLIDGPPMLGISDAPLIANAVDGVVFVIVHAKTSVRSAKAVINRLRGTNARLIGVVVTRFVAKAGDSYGYAYDYAYSYRDAVSDKDEQSASPVQ
jgi:capsular exopolysaccharide synthesis family protein